MSKDNEKEKQGSDEKPKQDPKKILEVPIITDKREDAQNSFDKKIIQGKKE